MKFLLRIIYFSLLCLLFTPSVQAQKFTKLYFFGDSLSDLSNGNGAPHSNGSNLWSKVLADKYSINLTSSGAPGGGTDWAVSGAYSGHGNYYDNNGMGVKDELDNFFLANTHLDRHAFYSVWAGANDIFGPILRDRDDPVTVLNNTINNIITAADRLHAAGARYLLIPNLIALGDTPLGYAQSATDREALTEVSDSFNNGLAGRVNSLSYDVIQIDIRSLFTYTQNNPAKFGFTNITDQLSQCTVGDCTPSHYLFWDEIHPTQAGHKIVADYVYSILQGPLCAALLAEVPFVAIDAQHQLILNELHNRQSRQMVPGKVSVFAAGDIRSAVASNISLVKANYTATNLHTVVGTILPFDDQWLVGAALGYTLNPVAVDHDDHFTLHDNLLSLFTRYQHAHGMMAGVVDLGAIRYQNMQRHFSLGPANEVASAETNGVHFGAEVNALYNLIDQPHLKTGPVVSMAYQHLVINAYNEEGSVAALSFAKQTNQSLVSRVGWQASYQMLFDNKQVTPFGQITLNKQWCHGERDVDDTMRKVGFNLVTMPGSHSSVSVPYAGDPLASSPHQLAVSADVGVATKISKDMGLTVSYANTLQKNYKYQSISLGINLAL